MYQFKIVNKDIRFLSLCFFCIFATELTEQIMSKNKKISLTLLWLVNVILLTHQMIPHHHHEDEAIPSSERCIIDHAYTLSHNHTKATCHIHTKCSCGQVSYALTSNSLQISDSIYPVPIHYLQNPYVPIFYAELVSHSIGLRAPPVC